MTTSFKFRLRHLWLLPAVLLLVPAVWALRWSLADIYHYQGALRIEQWRDGAQVTITEWQLAQHGLSRALELNPGSGTYLDLMGHLWLWKAADQPWDDMSALYAHSQALDWFRKAAAAQPPWPYTWSRLLDMKRRLGQFDAEFDHALNRAASLGPWEPGVQLMLADVLVRNDSNLTEQQRQLLQAAAGRGLRHVHPTQRARMAQLLRLQQGALEAMCRLPDVRSASAPVQACQTFYTAYPAPT